MSAKWFVLRSAGLSAMFLAVLVSCLIIVVMSVAAIPVEIFYLIKGAAFEKGMAEDNAAVVPIAG